MSKYIFCLFVAIAATACSRYPADVERALKLAGDNRAELEKVLEHYGKRPEDALKLKAAFFLIAGMPCHFTVHDDRLESFRAYLAENEPHEELLNIYTKAHGPIKGNREIKPDLYHVTSGFLIRNIDFSFRLWQETPWGTHFSFDVFCSDILPYRISNEPLENWKEAYHAVFRPVIDSMEQNNNLEAVGTKLLKHIQDLGWTLAPTFGSHGLGASVLLQSRFGNCKEAAEYVAYVFRSVGIPSGIDMTIQNPDDRMVRGHFMNYRRDISGKTTGFDYYIMAEGRPSRKNGKIYRQHFALQKESFPVTHKDSHIPPGGLRDVLLRDVSSEYFPDTHVSVHLESQSVFGKRDLAYLCVFNGKGWTPVTGCKPENGMATFRNVESGILYQVRFIDGTKDMAVSKPFILFGNENARFYDADTISRQSMTLYRKFRLPLVMPDYLQRAVGGKFQGANRADFSDSVTLHTIRKAADMSYADVQPAHRGPFRYVRYLSAPGGYNNMAEVRFYSEGKLLRGEVTGTDGARDIFPNSTKQAVFDDDPLTFFDAVEADGAWAGLQLDRAYQIDMIRYMFRNDDNHIRPGDTYELFYQRNSEWVPAGRQIADTTLLRYDNIPSNTLYWLRNHTRGIEERPFTYENDRQVFW